MAGIVARKLNLTTFNTALTTHLSKGPQRAFFTMEVYDRGKRPGGGGLGTLSRDMMKECADEGLHIVFVTIAHKDVQQQKFTSDFWQNDGFVDAKLDEDPNLVKLDHKVHIYIQGKDIPLSVYGTFIEGRKGIVPGILLSSADCGNFGFERITDRVYPGRHDPFATLGQEIILGIGGLKILKELRIPVELYHLNDAHAALVAPWIIQELGIRPEKFSWQHLVELRQKIVFTSHTLLGEAADLFSADLVSDLIRDLRLRELVGILGAQPIDGKLKFNNDFAVLKNTLDMVGMAMFAAGKINAVSKLNVNLLRQTFPQHDDRIVGGITNAVHPDWASPSIKKLYHRVEPNWEEVPQKLIKIKDLQNDSQFRKELWDAHMEAKLALIKMVSESKELIVSSGLDPEMFGRDLDPYWLTIGFARRVVGYKRHDLLFKDLTALVAAVAHNRPVQFVFAGKAHPMDADPGGGKFILQNLLRAAMTINKEFGDKIKFIFLPNYNVDIARILIPGVDLWLNNPVWGLEASGTSTMDAILNAVLLLTTVDGCVPEMLERGDIGWTFGIKGYRNNDYNYTADAHALYAVLSALSENYYYSLNTSQFNIGGTSLWLDKIIETISQVVPYFLTPRLIEEYKNRIWNLA